MNELIQLWAVRFIIISGLIGGYIYVAKMAREELKGVR